MNKAFLSLTSSDDIASGRGAVLTHPDDVLADRDLSHEAKRAILASWASDRHAVENEPSLRRLDSGAVVALDDILAALATLDAGDAPGSALLRGPDTRRRRLAAMRLSKLLRRSDDDDDPPPTPAVASRPVRIVRTKAVGSPVGRLLAAAG